MKTILSVVLVLALILSLGSCSLLDGMKDQIDEMGSQLENELGVNLNNDALQNLFQQGLEGLEDFISQGFIEATGEAANNEAGMLHVYADKLVLTVNTDGVRAKMEDSGVTVDSIKAERANAETAQMDYTLQYQYIVQIRINEKDKAAICYATVTEDTLSNTVDITIPVATEEMGVTIYELLQGGNIVVESCLQHGTETTKSVTDTYYLNAVPEGKTGNTLTMQDHREG
ncbi:MAG: hypothetical protein IJZ68_07915 [Bacteroidaceae bacterium]|nr:hypothetical protein [Bacteroidaceae bacterium]